MIDKNVFTDKVRITIKAGDGGDGMNSFKAFKGKPACGPDGGDGGKGGDVYLVADRSLNDLLSFRFTNKYVAGNGERGGTNRCSGRGGADVIIKVPVGTIVKDYETGRLLCDMFRDGDKKLIAEGGRGGKGNVRFTTARRHAPNFAQKGEKTKEHILLLELKVIADVDFTTLSPNLGVVSYYEDSFVAADIPGLIEGASQGAGLGHDFLKHIERTRMLLHVVDVSGIEGRDPVEDFKKINSELSGYSQKLAALPQVIALNKCDIPGAEDNVKAFKKAYGGKFGIYCISAVAGEGTRELIGGIVDMLKTLPPVAPVECPEEDFAYRAGGELEFDIFVDENGVYVVVGTLVDMLCRNVSLSDPDSMAYFQKILREKGVISRLKDMGVKEGDTVSIGDVEFDFVN